MRRKRCCQKRCFGKCCFRKCCYLNPKPLNPKPLNRFGKCGFPAFGSAAFQLLGSDGVKGWGTRDHGCVCAWGTVGV
jgi:hypothetical protein